MSIRITDRERNAILSSLGAGVVPRLGLHHIQVGRKNEITAMIDDIKKIENDSAAVRFVVGHYGAGKSFFLNLIQNVALQRKLVVAKSDFTTERRLHSTTGQARALYSSIMGSMATLGKPEGGALSNILERWIGDLSHKIQESGGNEQEVSQKIDELCDPLKNLVSGFDFVKILKAYYSGFCQSNSNLQAAALKWIRGEYNTRTEAKQDLAVRTIIDDENYYENLKLFAAFLKIAGFKGFLICLDELVVLSHRLNNKIARNNNYEAILRIVNDCLQGNVQNIGFIFAATDDCLTDKRRGLFSYDALERRLAENRFVNESLMDFTGPVLRLNSLTPEDCMVLLHNIRRVHLGDTPNYLPDEGIEAYLLSCQQRMGSAYFQTPGETVKDFIGLLNVLRQNPGTNWRSLLLQIKTSAPEKVDPSEKLALGQNSDESLADLNL